ncbi:hypothetical protein D3C76_1395720 [compost metagenome]
MTFSSTCQDTATPSCRISANAPTGSAITGLINTSSQIKDLDSFSLSAERILQNLSILIHILSREMQRSRQNHQQAKQQAGCDEQPR